MATYEEAVKHLQDSPRAMAKLVDRDATLSHYVWRSVWLGSDGALEMSHPTQDLGRIRAPKDGRYSLGVRRPARFSLDNGRTYKTAAELTDAECARICSDGVIYMDDDVREWCHGRTDDGDHRAFLVLYSERAPHDLVAG